MRVPITEDERGLNETIVKKLTSDGHSMDRRYDGKEVISVSSYTDYDTAILGIMIPRAGGFAVSRLLRGAGKATPALFPTVGDTVSDRVKGLDSGTNDYLVKPFALEELSARLCAVTYVLFGMTENVTVVVDLTLDYSGQTVRCTSKDINLFGKEYALPEYFMRSNGLVLSHEEIENYIRNLDYEGSTSVVDVYVSYLHHRVDDGSDKKLIHMVRDRGYILAEDRSV